MAQFSSRGPLGDFLKPDVTAPGVQILAGNTPTPVDVASGRPASSSRRSPAPRCRARTRPASRRSSRRRTRLGRPGQIKSALMTSSSQTVFKEDGSPADPFDRGAGSIRADPAVAAVATISETPAGLHGGRGPRSTGSTSTCRASRPTRCPGAVTTYRTLTKRRPRRTSRSGSTATGANGLQGQRVAELVLGAGRRHQRPWRSRSTARPRRDGSNFGQITLSSTRSGTPGMVHAGVGAGGRQRRADDAHLRTDRPGPSARTRTCTVT